MRFQVSAVVLLVAALAGPPGAARAQSQSITHGQQIAQRNCAMCHAIGPAGVSPNPAAPPFRDLNRRFPVEDLEAGVLANLLTGHPAMPQIRLPPGDIHDLLDYLKSLPGRRTAEAPAAVLIAAGAGAE